jgi:hypothetical protein
MVQNDIKMDKKWRKMAHFGILWCVILVYLSVNFAENVVFAYIATVTLQLPLPHCPCHPATAILPQ